ncbi:MAG: 50S ribosomal protein L22 [Planctomycetota bacterium]|nr:MAG: 50S ribosomal protein L22 [Planctomycetota bacterium]
MARPGLSADDAARAIANWRVGRNHPRAKAADVRALAEALSCRPADIARFETKARFVRSSARKARLMADLIRGRRVDDAVTLLEFNHRRAATMVVKALKTAIADAEQSEADIGRLVVAESRVDGGPIIKRFRPKDRGRAHPIRKRTSHIVVGVEEAA